VSHPTITLVLTSERWPHPGLAPGTEGAEVGHDTVARPAADALRRPAAASVVVCDVADHALDTGKPTDVISILENLSHALTALVVATLPLRV
jgi:hypothetical protein